jgi:hypothetical protein
MNLYTIQNTFFNIFIIISYILFALFVTGYYKDSKKYLDIIDSYVKIYISVFLIYRFNPFRSVNFSDLDRKVVYSAGLMLFATSAVNQVIVSYLSKWSNAFSSTNS